MRGLILFFTITCSVLTAQNIDYNLKKGFIARGYDVVSYFNNNPKEGNKAFKVVFDGVNYKFFSAENMSKFNQNPERYIPQYGGYCAYAIAKKSEKVSIDPETFLIKDGKLYLFYNVWGKNTLKLWKQNDEQKLIQTGDENWKKIKFKK